MNIGEQEGEERIERIDDPAVEPAPAEEPVPVGAT